MRTIILGIESTAHTFGVGVVSDEEFILADARAVYTPSKGGIHPRESSRYLATEAPNVIKRALEEAKIGIEDITAIAVSLGPGLGPVLRVGATIARALASYYRKPLIPVNHAVAHVEIGLKTTGAKDPVIVYLSGGNSAVIALIERRYRVFGETLDIALGNLLDTFAREVGLGPPYVVEGLHVVDRCAERGEEIVEDIPYVVKGQDLTFSGILTAALKAYRRGVKIENICYTLREIAYSMVAEVAERCLAHTKKREIMVVGGVAASPILREKIRRVAERQSAEVYIVSPKYAVDNGVMIAWTGLLEYKAGVTVEIEKSFVRPRWRIDEVDIVWRS
ncbi:MAG: KEOPS complex N(6)-L-threonylcarbamoyladenine synthase Kae1 [Sulfolobales archaeon]